MSLARKTPFSRFYSDRGSSLVEYALLLAFMAAVALYAAQLFGSAVNGRISLVVEDGLNYQGGGSTGTLKPEEGESEASTGQSSGDQFGDAHK